MGVVGHDEREAGKGRGLCKGDGDLPVGSVLYIAGRPLRIFSDILMRIPNITEKLKAFYS